VYNRASKNVETVHGIAAGKLENPRMIMVFDSAKENGDVETVGYDPLLGEVVPLAVTPTPLPEQIPDPEPSEQGDKAFVQPSSTTPRVESRTASSSGSGDDPNSDATGTGGTTTPTVPGEGNMTTVGSNTHATSTLEVTPPLRPQVGGEGRTLNMGTSTSPRESITPSTPNEGTPTSNASSTLSRGEIQPRIVGGEGRVVWRVGTSTESVTDISELPQFATQSVVVETPIPDLVIPPFASTTEASNSSLADGTASSTH
jgi:hypothetical protein